MKRYIGKELRQLEEHIDKMPDHHVEQFRLLAAGQDGQLDNAVIIFRIKNAITAMKNVQK